MPTKRSVPALTICLLFLLLLGSVGFMSPAKTLATTGPSDFLPPSPYQVPMKLAELYVGRYQLRSVASGARIRTAAMGIEINSRHQLYGVAQFSGYEQSFQSIWIATLYNFHQTKKVMTFDILAQTGSPLIGRMYLTRSSAGDLVGQIELAKRRFAISWHKTPK